MNPEIVDALAVAMEVCGTDLSAAAQEFYVRELSVYPQTAVESALRRCTHEVKGRLTLSEIISRIDDGRPTADEAWAMLTWSEWETMVVTEETLRASGVARSLMEAGDKVGARLAFRDAYNRLVQDSRERRAPVHWQASLGWDRDGRTGPVCDAIQRGRLPAQAAQELLPWSEEAQQIAAQTLRQLPAAQKLLQSLPPCQRRRLEPARQETTP